MKRFDNHCWMVAIGIVVALAIAVSSQSASAKSCPLGKKFKTTKKWKGCKCPQGYRKEYRGTKLVNKAFKKYAKCVKGENKSPRKLCKEKKGTWVGWSKKDGVCLNVPVDKVMKGVDSATNPLYHAYSAYFLSIVGSGVTMRNLPQDVQTKLGSFFGTSHLKKVTYGSSHHTSSSNTAMTDCDRIYFPAGSEIVEVIKSGKIFRQDNADDLHWLLHELAHTAQCKDVGGRSKYAAMWFGELGATTIKELLTNPRKISNKKIHDKMPMEAAAKKRADEISNEFAKAAENKPPPGNRKSAPTRRK